jgi:hypothetical protein
VNVRRVLRVVAVSSAAVCGFVFCSAQSYGGIFLFSPAKNKKEKENGRRKDTGKNELLKLLEKYRIENRKHVNSSPKVNWKSLKILGIFNDECMVSYEGDRFLVPRRVCDELELKRIRLLKELGR